MNSVSEKDYSSITGLTAEQKLQTSDFFVKELLGRDVVIPQLTDAARSIFQKTILVTGGGGSIGSELCRQIASFRPARLIIFDIYENNAFIIQRELTDLYPTLKTSLIIGSVRDSRRLEQVFSEYRPDIVFHAAAHKHVPLLEDNPSEAIKNNVIGTYKTAYAAMVYGCSRFVLISTDKAVEPTSVMGASKLLCEMIISLFDSCIRQGKCNILPHICTHTEDGVYEPAELPAMSSACFVCVRFGNVLGSNGSVIPIFREQIKNGGPVKVTHPEVVRYFMTVSEAVSLVLTASAKAQGGEIYVLDMGEPVKIDTLARNLIRLSGLEPDVDIKIEYTGLRRGEKLFEVMLKPEECLGKTSDRHIFIGKTLSVDIEAFSDSLIRLMNAAYDNSADIKAMLKCMLPSYNPS